MTISNKLCLLINLLVVSNLLLGCGANSKISPSIGSNYEGKNIKIEERITNVVENRNEIIFVPNETQPFTGVYKNTLGDGKKIEIHFKNGIMNGNYKVWYPNGQKYNEVNFVNGKANGLATYWDENGQKGLEINQIEGINNGLATEWYKNGNKKSEVNYLNGKKNGTAIFWNEQGQKTEENYSDGKSVEKGQ